MKYQLALTKNVKKNLDALETPHKEKVRVALDTLKLDPYIGKKLNGEYEGSRSYRVWPYRIIYEIYSSKSTILIIKIGHRQGVY